MLDCSANTIRRYLRKGKIKAEKKYPEDIEDKRGRKPWVIDDDSFYGYYRLQEKEDNLKKVKKERIYVDFAKYGLSYRQIALKYNIGKRKVVEIIFNYKKIAEEKGIIYLYITKCKKCVWSKKTGRRKRIEKYVCLFPYCIDRNNNS